MALTSTTAAAIPLTNAPGPGPDFGTRQLNFALAQEGRPRLPALLFCMMLPLLWDGVPFAAVGLPRAGGFYVTTMLVVIGICLFAFRVATKRARLTLFHGLSILIALTFLGTSFLSGLMFFDNPVDEWMPQLVYYSPCLLIFLIQSLDIRLSELTWGIALAASISAMLVIVDRIHNLSMMDSYLAVSGFDNHARRIMILKNETGLAVCLGFAWFIVARSVRQFMTGLIIFCVTSFVLVQVIETRLVIGGALLAMASFLLTTPRLERRMLYIVVAILVLAVAGPLIFAKYIHQLEGMSSLSDDGSVQWRMLTVENYRKYFNQTYGMGFGIMSVKQYANNILSFSLYEAPTLVGIPRGAWSFFLADISFYGALYQFGYLGFALVVGMTTLTAVSLIRYGLTRGLPYREPVAAAGFFVLFLLISPWPTNMFTLPWSIMSGNMLFSLAARADGIRRRVGRRDTSMRLSAPARPLEDEIVEEDISFLPRQTTL